MGASAFDCVNSWVSTPTTLSIEELERLTATIKETIEQKKRKEEETRRKHQSTRISRPDGSLKIIIGPATDKVMVSVYNDNGIFRASFTVEYEELQTFINGLYRAADMNATAAAFPDRAGRTENCTNG